jgi:voltage-gated potassium channel
MASDAENLFTTLSARLLNAKLTIVARVEGIESEGKLLRAGANRVVSPYQIGGMRVAHAVIKPTVVDFIELTTRTEHIELQLEEERIEPHSPLAGKTLAASRLGADLHVIILTIKKKSGHMVFNPPPVTRLEVGDTLVAIGSRDQLGRLADLANPRG